MIIDADTSTTLTLFFENLHLTKKKILCSSEIIVFSRSHCIVGEKFRETNGVTKYKLLKLISRNNFGEREFLVIHTVTHCYIIQTSKRINDADASF